MSLSSLQILVDNREALLLAEVGALIHNIGKLSEEFQKYQAGEMSFKGYDYRAITGIVSELIPSTLTNKESQRLQNAIQANQEEITKGLLAANQKNWLKDRQLDLPVPLDDHTYALGDFVEFQDFSWYKQTTGGSPPRITLLFKSGSRVTELLEASHNAASGVEKEGASNAEGRQTVFPFRVATAFGLEIPMDAGKFKVWRDDLLDALKREGLSVRQLAHFEKAVGDTRRPINEVRLSDLSFSVASLFKSALAQAIITRKWTPRNDLRWRILRVNFDVLGLYAQAIKIADVLAYQRVVGEACAAVKKLVEEDYPLGNEVYRDSTGIYFTFPDLDLPNDLAYEIRRRVETIEAELAPRIAVEQSQGSTASEQLKRLLGDARTNARQELAQLFTSENFNSGWQSAWGNQDANKKWEVCPVCRLRPMQEKSEACETCLARRSSRIETWKENPTQTIWLDEIADKNSRVALVVGKFGLDDWLTGNLVQTLLVKAVENQPGECASKNPSPARLRRVWETCERFWTDTAADILNAPKERTRWTLNVGELPKEMLEGAVCDGALNGQFISVWRQGNQLLTISFVAEKPAGQLNVEWESNGRKFKLARQIRDAQEAADPFSRYRPSLTLFETPDQFLAFVPASDALNIAAKIRSEYEKQFGKVQNRLPLFLGIVFFPRKMPLTAALDTARRMLEQTIARRPQTTDDQRTRSWNEEEWTVAEDVNDGKVKFTNGVEWNVQTTMGDGTTPDVWYPYFVVEGSPNGRKYAFQREGRWLVHVNDLRAGDVVRITPSRFAYLFLESAAQRFQFDIQKDGMWLNELPRLIEMWEQFRSTPQMSDTKLQAIRALFENKWAMWRLDEQDADISKRRETFRALVETTFRKEKISNIPTDDVMNGLFKRCLDLHLGMLKQRIDKQNNKEQSNEQQLTAI